MLLPSALSTKLWIADIYSIYNARAGYYHFGGSEGVQKNSNKVTKAQRSISQPTI